MYLDWTICLKGIDSRMLKQKMSTFLVDVSRCLKCVRECKTL